MSAAMKPILFSTPMVQAILDGRKTMTRRVVKNIKNDFDYSVTINNIDDSISKKIIGEIPKYQVGDVLWVRETWCKAIMDRGTAQEKEIFLYRADEGREWTQPNDGFNIQWKPSIFMPKEYARIFLRVTNVRVERLQDISVEDILKEGAPLITITGNNEDFINSKLKGWWYDLWNSINGKGSWEANPYVFVYTFQRVEKPKEMK